MRHQVFLCMLDMFGRSGQPFPIPIGYACTTREAAMSFGVGHYRMLYDKPKILHEEGETPRELEWHQPEPHPERPYWHAEEDDLMYYILPVAVEIP